MAREQVYLEFLGEAEGAKRASVQTVQSIQNVERQSKKSSGAMKHHAEEAVAANALLTGSFTRMARSAVTAGAGFAIAYVGIAKAKDAISTTAELAHQTELLHRNTGLAVKTASGLEAVLKARGVDANSLGMAFQTLGRNIVGASAGAVKTQAAFSALGISVKDLKSAHGDLNVLLPRIADGFGNLKGGADRLAVSQALLGRGYRSILPLFADGAKGLQRNVDAAAALGATLDEKTLRQLDRLHAAQIKNQEAALGLKIAFTTAATPALLDLSKLAQRVAKDFQGPGSLDDKLGRVGKDLAPAVNKIEGVFEAAIPKIANHVGKDAPKVAEAFVHGFGQADIWGQLVLATFLVKALGGWKKIFAAAGLADATAWGAGFLPTVEGEAAAAGQTAGSKFAAGFRKTMFYGIAAAITTDLYHNLVGPVNGLFDQLGLALNASDPTNGKGQANADARAGHIKGVKSVPTFGSVIGDIIKGVGGKSLTGAAQHQIANAAAAQYGIPAALLWGVYGTETGYGKNVNTSSAGAKGAFQFMPGTASSYGYNYTNKQTPGIFANQAGAAAHYLADLIKQKGGNIGAALTAYSGGGYSSVPGFNPGSKSYSDYLAGLNQKKAKANTTPADLAWAQSMVGHFKESLGSNTGPELDRLQKEFGTHAAEWCAEFATQALVKAGFPKGVKTPSVKTINEMAGAGAFGLGFTTSPKPGDLVTFGNNHVAIVEKVDAHKGTVQTIAGNTGAGKVSRSTYAIGAGRYISVDAAGAGVGAQGFGKPAVYHYPRIKQSDFMNFIQGQENHFDLMVGAGLMTQQQANAAKRKVLVGNLSELRGDTKLSALGMLKALTPGPARSAAGGMAAGVLQSRDDWATAASLFARRSGIDPNSVAGLQFAGKGLASHLTADNSAINRLRAGIWDATNKGQKDLAKSLGDELKGVISDREETLTQIAENTKDTAQAVKDAAQQASFATAGLAQGGGSIATSILSLMKQPGGKDALSLIGGLNLAPAGPGAAPVSLQQILASGDPTQSVVDILKNSVLPAEMNQLNAPGLTDEQTQGIWQQILGTLGEIAGFTSDTASNTQDLSDFWHQRALQLASAYQISQSQYSVLAGAKIGGMPFLGGFDAGGRVPGPVGQPGYALVHGGETILPTHKGGGTPAVHVYVSADASAMGVRVNQQIGRDARRRSVAPGR